MAFQDIQVTRVRQVLRGSLDSQEWMEPKDPKDTEGILQGTVTSLGQRVNKETLDVQDILEKLENGACQVLKDPEDHREDQDHLAPSDPQGVQVTQECLDRRDIQEQWGILDQEVSQEIQGHPVFPGYKVPQGHQVGTACMA